MTLLETQGSDIKEATITCEWVPRELAELIYGESEEKSGPR